MRDAPYGADLFEAAPLGAVFYCLYVQKFLKRAAWGC
jgi:hypothetical protein